MNDGFIYEFIAKEREIIRKTQLEVRIVGTLSICAGIAGVVGHATIRIYGVEWWRGIFTVVCIVLCPHFAKWWWDERNHVKQLEKNLLVFEVMES